jgi:tetratricopeptide (TPR) repeat protein
MKRVLLGLALLFCATSASAETPPSVWDRAKDPSIESSWALHVETQAALHNIVEMRRVQLKLQLFPGLQPPEHVEVDAVHAALQRVVERLDRFGAEKSADVRLRFDLGEVLLAIADHEVDRQRVWKRAADVLRGALAIAPDEPGADDAWLNLAFACGHLGDHECESKTYREVLRRRTEDSERRTPLLNLAETDMHMGQLQDAIEGYRETIRVAARVSGDGDTAPLATWGLAIALDRSGDHAGAEREAKTAISRERSVLRLPAPPHAVSALLHSSGVFFYPEYEIEWYDGLGDVALAREMKDPHDQVTEWQDAERHFSTYVTAAEKAPRPDRFLEIAKARLAAVRSELAAAQKRAAKAPKPKPPPPDEDVTF